MFLSTDTNTVFLASECPNAAKKSSFHFAWVWIICINTNNCSTLLRVVKMIRIFCEKWCHSMLDLIKVSSRQHVLQHRLEIYKKRHSLLFSLAQFKWNQVGAAIYRTMNTRLSSHHSVACNNNNKMLHEIDIVLEAWAPQFVFVYIFLRLAVLSKPFSCNGQNFFTCFA